MLRCSCHLNWCSVDHNSGIGLTSGLYFRFALNQKVIALDRDRQGIYNVHTHLDEGEHGHARMDRGGKSGPGILWHPAACIAVPAGSTSQQEIE